jgi:threonine synthase
MTGVETISHELAEQSEGTIDHVFCPAGGGGLALAVTRGFRMLVDRGDLDRSPAVEVVQPEGNNTMAGPLREGAECAREVESTTRISGMQVPNINDGHMVVEECRPTAGTGHLVTDEEVWAIQERLAREEGIFSEPAGAVALAGALNAVADGTVDAKARIVCVVTGSGFKDPEAVDRMLEGVGCPTVDLEAFVREVGRA